MFLLGVFSRKGNSKVELSLLMHVLHENKFKSIIDVYFQENEILSDLFKSFNFSQLLILLFIHILYEYMRN